MTIWNNDEARAFFRDNGFLEEYNDGITAYLRQLLGKDLSLPDLLREYLITYGTTEFTSLVAPIKNYNFLSGSLDPDFTFTRATTGYYYDSTGALVSAAINTPRFDYNPSTLVLKGLLVEDAATNLCLQSQTLDNATWLKGNITVTADATTAPDGTLTADEMVETTATNTHSLQQANVATSIPIGTVYTFSLYAKAGTGNRRLQIIFGGSAYVGIYSNFNFQTETLTLGAGIISGRFDKLPNGWYKITISAATTVDLGFFSAFIRLSDNNSANFRSYTGDGVSSVYIWGAQIELGNFGTSYIPTVAATASRSADSLSISGLTFSGFWNASEGTLSLKGINAGDTSGVYLTVNDTTSLEQILFNRTSATDVNIKYTDGGVDQFDQTLTGSTNYSSFGMSLGYKLNDSNCAVNNVLGTLDTSCTLPTATQLIITGQTFWLDSMKYYNVRMNDNFIKSLSRI